MQWRAFAANLYYKPVSGVFRLLVCTRLPSTVCFGEFVHPRYAPFNPRVRSTAASHRDDRVKWPVQPQVLLCPVNVFTGHIPHSRKGQLPTDPGVQWTFPQHYQVLYNHHAFKCTYLQACRYSLPPWKVYEGRDLSLLFSLKHTKHWERRSAHGCLLSEWPSRRERWAWAWLGWQEMKCTCFLEIPCTDRGKEKFCIQISRNSLLINSCYRLIKKAKHGFYCGLTRLHFSAYTSWIHSPGRRTEDWPAGRAVVPWVQPALPQDAVHCCATCPFVCWQVH